MTCDTGHVTCDTWHVTHDRWEEQHIEYMQPKPYFYLQYRSTLKINMTIMVKHQPNQRIRNDVTKPRACRELNLLSKFQLPSSYCLGVRGDTWHMTSDTWHVTYDMLQMTCAMWHTGVMIIVSNLQVPSSYGLGVKVWVWRFGCEYSELKDHSIDKWMNKLFNHKGVCRTAPATPGLLIIYKQKISIGNF